MEQLRAQIFPMKMQIKLILSGLIANMLEQETSAGIIWNAPKDKLTPEEKETLKAVWSIGIWVECNSDLEYAIATWVAQIFDKLGDFKSELFNNDQVVIRRAFEYCLMMTNWSYSSDVLDNFRFVGVVHENYNSDFRMQPAYIAFKATDHDV